MIFPPDPERSAELRDCMGRAFREASTAGRAVCLMAVAVDAAWPRHTDTQRALGRVRSLLEDGLDPSALWLRTEGEVLWALVEGMGAEEGETVARSVIGAAGRGADGVRLALSVGLAENREGLPLTFGTLERVAEEGLRVSRARGGECAVHTMLYGLFPGTSEPVVERQPQKRRLVRPAPASTAPPPHSSEAPSSPPAEDADDLERRARALALRWTNEALERERRRFAERLRAAEAQGQAPREAEGLLRRRIAKLVSTLEETERRLVEVSRLKDVDPGIPSIYRSVQGIEPTDRDYSLKIAMMKRLVDANLALRERVAS